MKRFMYNIEINALCYKMNPINRQILNTSKKYKFDYLIRHIRWIMRLLLVDVVCVDVVCVDELSRKYYII